MSNRLSAALHKSDLSQLISLLGQKGNELVNRIYWQLFLSKDTFERVFEPILFELIQDHLDLSIELLWVAPMDVSLDAVEIRTQANHDEVTGIGLSPAVEFHREQKGRFRDSPVEVFGDVK